MARLPTITSDIPRDLRQYLERVREAINGRGEDELVTVRRLVSSGLADLQGSTLIPTAPGTVTYAPPPAPTNLQASGALANIILTWDEPTYPGHAYTEVWAAEAPLGGGNPDIGEAERVGMAPGSVFAHNLGSGATRWYWVRFVNVADQEGPFNAVEGVLGATGQDPDYLLGLLSGQITESQLFSTLGERINLIDGPGSLIGSVNARIEGLEDQILTPAGQVRSTLLTGYYTEAEADSAISASQTTLRSEITRSRIASDFAEDGRFWSNSLTGAPASKAPLSSLITFATDAEMGRVAVMPAPITFNRHIAPIPYLPNVAGTRYRATITAKHIGAFAGGSQNALTFGLWKIRADFAYDSVLSTGISGILVFTAPDTVQTFTREWTCDGATPYFNPFVYFSTAFFGVAGPAISIQSIDVVDTTAASDVAADLTTNYYTRVDTDSAVAAAQTNLRSEIQGTRSALLPSNFQSGFTNWTETRLGDPATIAPVTSRCQFVSNDADFGACVEFTTSGVGQNIMTRGVIPGGDRVYRIRARFKALSAPAATHRYNFMIQGMNASYASTFTSFPGVTTVAVGSNIHEITLTFAATAGSGVDLVIPAIASSAYIRSGFRVDLTGAAVARVASITIEDVTDAVSLSASLAVEASTRASADGSLQAQYTVKVETNGYVSGFGLASTANNATPTSSFIVRSDSFAIASPSGPGITPAQPFIVRTTPTTINGVSVPTGVYITDAFVQNGTISNAKIGNLAVDSAKIADASIVTAKIANAAITNAKIANAAIGTAQIQNAAITSALIGNAAVGTANIANAAIGTAQIADAAITQALIANAAVGTAQIANAAIGSAQIADAAIGSAQIANAAIGSAQIANAAIGSAQIANAAITSAKIGTLQVQSANIANLTVGTDKITASAVTSAGAAGGSGGPTSAAWLTIAQFTLSTLGSRTFLAQAVLLIDGEEGGGEGVAGAAAVRLLINGVNYQQSQYYQDNQVPLMGIATSTAGSMTVTIQAIRSPASTAGVAVNGVVYGLELKK